MWSTSTRSHEVKDMADMYTVYSYRANRKIISTEDIVAFVKSFRNQAKKGYRPVKYTVQKANGKTYYKVFVQ